MLTTTLGMRCYSPVARTSVIASPETRELQTPRRGNEFQNTCLDLHPIIPNSWLRGKVTGHILTSTLVTRETRSKRISELGSAQWARGMREGRHRGEYRREQGRRARRHRSTHAAGQCKQATEVA